MKTQVLADSDAVATTAAKLIAVEASAAAASRTLKCVSMVALYNPLQ